MFSPEDFELPLEKQLRMRVVAQEIDQCKDVEVLQEHLKQCAESLMKYQHLLGVAIKKQLLADLEVFDSEISKIVKEAIEKTDDTIRTKEG